jgi:lipoate-protein ligase B
MMEDIMIQTSADFGVKAGRNPKNRGVWVGNNKLGSIGIAVRKGISFHGFALNANPSLLHFKWINPCGLTDIGVTSLAKELSEMPPMADVKKAVKTHMENVFKFKFQQTTTNVLKFLISADKHEPKTEKTSMA